MFSTEGQKVKGAGLNKSFEPGRVLAHIYSATVKTSSNNKKMLELVLEGPALPDFEGWAVDRENPDGTKFKGQSARVTATIYNEHFNSDDVNKNEILNKLVIMSDELELRKQVDALANDGSITSIEQWVEKVVEVLQGHDLNFFLVGTESEYNGKINVKLSLPKFKFCSNDVEKLNVFDKTNKYHFVPLAGSSSVTKFTVKDDFDV